MVSCAALKRGFVLALRALTCYWADVWPGQMLQYRRVEVRGSAGTLVCVQLSPGRSFTFLLFSLADFMMPRPRAKFTLI